MPISDRKIRIFVASPGDVQSERDQLAKVITELNLTISALAPEKGIVLELLRWETHVHPGIGADAQKVVTAQMPDYDIFVGMMWKRMGTPTTTSQSGTEEEFQHAYEKWEKNRSLPVLFYFCQQTSPPPRSREEMEQLTKVVLFRENLASKGLLLGDYADHESFADVVRPHLLLVLGQMFSSNNSTLEAAQLASENTGSAEVSAVRVEILALAQEYEDIRKSMPSGNARTGTMELIASRMRSLALPAYPLLTSLAGSESTGQRLAAISILESIPTPSHLMWLADRVSTEAPFVAYHATVALLQAARNLRATKAGEVRKALTQARENFDKLPWKDPNQLNVLQNAENELSWAERKKSA